MFVRTKEKGSGKTAVQVVESVRLGPHVRQKIVRNMGVALNKKEIDTLKRMALEFIAQQKLEIDPVLPTFSKDWFLPSEKAKPVEDKVRVKDLREQKRLNNGISDIFGQLYTQLNFDDLLKGTKKDGQWNGILKSCVLARIADPQSKRKTQDILERNFDIKVPLEKIYRCLDHVSRQEEKIKDAVASSTLNLFNQKVDVLFFDVTTLYFESIIADDLKGFGFSKDCKFKEVQVVLALVTTEKGLPITYELFPGDMYEGHTLITMIECMQKCFDVNNVVLVADRGMFNEDNLALMDEKKISYIVAAKLRSLPKALKNRITDSHDFKLIPVQSELHWVNEFTHKDRRLIVSYSSLRAKRDAKQRQRLIERLLKKVKNKKVKLKDMIPNQGTKKFLKFEPGAEATIDQIKIDHDAKWDGLHGVLTNIKDKKIPAILSRYRGLWQIEEAFRINKHDLKMRPIFHWTPKRIKAHISLCFLAYTLAKHATYRMQNKISFAVLRDHLLDVQSSIVLDTQTDKKYAIPSLATPEQKAIYKAFGQSRTEIPYYIA